MEHSLVIWLDDCDENSRRQAYCRLLGALPSESSSLERWTVRVATFREHRLAEGRIFEMDRNAPGSSVMEVMRAHPDSCLAFDADTWWRAVDFAPLPASCPTRDATITFTYLGSNVHILDWDGRVVKHFDPRSEGGDLAIDFDPGLLETAETAAAANGGLRREDLDQIDIFVVSALQILSPVDAILAPSPDVWRGGIVAWGVFHRDPVDFLRDLARELFLMEASLVSWERVAMAGRLGRDIPSVALAYHADMLRRPETLLTSERLKDLRENCARAVDTLKRHDATVVRRQQTCNARILELAKEESQLKESIVASQSNEVCEAIAECQCADLQTLANGYFVKHHEWNWEFPSIYDHLAAGVLEGRFVRQL